MWAPGPALLILLIATSLAMPQYKISPALLDSSWPTSSSDADVDDDALQLAVAYLNSRLHPDDALHYNDLFRTSDDNDLHGGGSHLLGAYSEDLGMELLTKQLEIVTALESELLARRRDADAPRLEDVDQEAAGERSRREASGGNRPPCDECRQIPPEQVRSRSRSHNDDGKDLSKETVRAKRDMENELSREVYQGSDLDSRAEEVDDSLFSREEKRAGDFNSWGGKRATGFNSWGGKRDNNMISSEPRESDKRAPEFNSWGGKRAPAFNSWGGKRAPAFNSWGGKRGPSFNSWGGKRGPSFNSWGGKRGPSFNSWGGKRSPSFNSWGGKRTTRSWQAKLPNEDALLGDKRAPEFNSWGGKRAPAFHSWGGKRATGFNSWGGKRATSFNSWGGKREVDLSTLEGKRAPAFNSWGGKRSLDTTSNHTAEMVPPQDAVDNDVDPIQINVKKRGDESNPVAPNAVDFYPWGGKRTNSI